MRAEQAYDGVRLDNSNRYCSAAREVPGIGISRLFN